MTLVLEARHRETIEREGRAAYPNECCGFLVGRDVEGAAQVLEVVPAVNTREDSPRNRYLIPPEVFARVQRDAAAQGLDIVGFYHSHPDVEARPSTFDREHAWPFYRYVIVSVHAATTKDLRAWRLRPERDAFDEIPIRFESRTQAGAHEESEIR